MGYIITYVKEGIHNGRNFAYTLNYVIFSRYPEIYRHMFLKK